MTAPLREQLGQALYEDATFSPATSKWVELSDHRRGLFCEVADRIIAAVPIIGAAEDMLIKGGEFLDAVAMGPLEIAATHGPDAVDPAIEAGRQLAIVHAQAKGVPPSAALAKATPERLTEPKPHSPGCPCSWCCEDRAKLRAELETRAYQFGEPLKANGDG